MKKLFAILAVMGVLTLGSVQQIGRASCRERV